jgi:glycosyltransferase involved in cell wall biosynthesis
MAAGVPVVVNGNWPGDLGEGHPARELYVEGGPQALAQRLIELLTSETLRAEAGHRGRALVRARHSWDVSTNRLAQVLDGALGSRPVPSEPVLDVRTKP